MSYRADLHVHSTFSFDGKMEPELIAQKAIEKGISYIALTEHLDLCRHPLEEFVAYAPHYFDKINRLNEKYEGKLRFLSAIEFAEPHRYPEEFDLVTREEFDYVLGSVHFVDGHSIALHELEGMDATEISRRYYEEVYAAVEFGGFDAFAHLDHIRRGVGADIYDETSIDDIMKKMIDNGILLEVNTSGIRRTDGGAFPNTEKVKRYIANGGSRVVIGSDTHIESNLYDHVEAVAQELTAMGLTPGIFRERFFRKQTAK